MTLEKQLIKAQREYIDFLGKELSRTAVYMDAHGQGASYAAIEEGIRRREEIANLEKLVGYIPNLDPETQQVKDWLDENIIAIKLGEISLPKKIGFMHPPCVFEISHVGTELDKFNVVRLDK